MMQNFATLYKEDMPISITTVINNFFFAIS